MTIVNKAHQGFTLIELLCAFMLFSVIMVMLYSSLHYASRATQLSNKALQQAEQLNRVDRRLRQWLGQSYPQHHGLKGSAGTLEFLAPLAGNGKFSLLHRITLSVDGPLGNRQLLVRWSPLEGPLVSQSQLAESGSLVLLDQLKAVEFSYLSESDVAAGSLWLSQWQQAYPPKVVRIHFTFTDSSGGWMPPLHIALHQSHSTDCRFDPVSRQCRNG